MIIFDANLRTKNKSPLAPPAGLDESRRHTSHEEGLPTEGSQYIRGNPSIKDVNPREGFRRSSCRACCQSSPQMKASDPH
jgi:hypothetical protein